MRGDVETNMLWEGLVVVVRDILCLGLGFYIYLLLMADGIFF